MAQRSCRISTTHSTYYDRSVPEGLEKLLLAGGALHWLPGALRQGTKNLALSDPQFRRDATGRPNGALQIYVGSTAILEVRGTQCRGTDAPSPDCFCLRVGAERYRNVVGRLQLGRHTSQSLAEAHPEIQAYLVRAAGVITDRWVTGESRVHAGMMRRYGLLGRAKAPFVAIDREIVLGHDANATRESVRTDLEKAHGTAQGRVPGELDVLAVLEDGSIGLVELKQHARDVALAAQQVEYYRDRFERLRASNDSACQGIIQLAQQKVRCGLLPDHSAIKKLGTNMVFRPVVAIPDDGGDWASRWRNQLAQVPREQRERLELWRLSGDGELIERARAV